MNVNGEDEDSFLENEDVLKGLAVLNILVSICIPGNYPFQPVDKLATPFFELLFQLISPIGLLANLASVMSIAVRWRADPLNDRSIPDTWWVMTFNSIALALGCFGNLVIFLHVKVQISRMTSLAASFVCYSLAVIIYVILLGVCESQYFGPHAKHLNRSEGYWQAVCATALYGASSLAILAHTLYFWGRKWDMVISHRQHKLMMLCILYAVWIAIGGATFQADTKAGYHYAEGVYFVVVSYLTLGYGDVVPTNNLSRALSIPFIYVGIVIGGMVSVCIFQASMNNVDQKIVYFNSSQDRQKLLERWGKDGLSHSDEDSFNAMRHILARRRLQRIVASSLTTILWLAIFWLIGAVIFSYVEGWTYFNAFYMCAISISSIGFGDFVPKTSGGRSFLIHWALVALPTMTAAVSALTSVVTVFYQEAPSIFRVNLKRRSPRDIERIKKVYPDTYQTVVGRALANPHLEKSLDSWQQILDIDAKKDGYAYDYDTWNQAMLSLFKVDKLPSEFWISETSPLRFPAVDEKSLLILIAVHIIKGEEATERSELEKR